MVSPAPPSKDGGGSPGGKKSPPEPKVEPPSPSSGATATVPGPSTEAPTPLQQKQLAEFNQWLFRWNNYQQHLAHYWQGRYHALYQQMASDGDVVVASGGGKARKGKKGKSGELSKGDKVEVKWNMRFQECECWLYELLALLVPFSW